MEHITPKLTITEHEQVAEKLAKELTHPDQDIALDDLESDMGFHFDLMDYVDMELPETNNDEASAIIDRAFEIARTSKEETCRACGGGELDVIDGALACEHCDTWQAAELQSIRGDVKHYKTNTN